VIHILVRVNEGGALTPVPGVTITLGRYRRTTDQDGDTTIITTLTHGRRYKLTATRAGTNRAHTTITATT
jgi:hypothetical protein